MKNLLFLAMLIAAVFCLAQDTRASDCLDISGLYQDSLNPQKPNLLIHQAGGTIAIAAEEKILIPHPLNGEASYNSQGGFSKITIFTCDEKAVTENTTAFEVDPSTRLPVLKFSVVRIYELDEEKNLIITTISGSGCSRSPGQIRRSLMVRI